jgi:hypothetical protein
MSFLERYTQWAIANCDQEVDAGLPNIRAIRNMGTCALCEHLVGRPKFLAKVLLKALLKSRYAETGLRCSEDELKAISEFRNNFESQRFSSFKCGILQPQVVCRAVEQCMEGLAGWKRTNESADVVYVSRIGEISISTRFSFGKRSYDLAYEHWVIGDDKVPIAQGISVLGWLGMGQTRWQNLEITDIETVIATLRANIHHFTAWVTLDHEEQD